MDLHKDKLAKKYAEAFINIYGDRLTLELAEQLAIVGDYLHKHREALIYVELSDIDGAITKKNFEELLTSFGVADLFNPLIELLRVDKRIFLLPRVMHHIYALYLERNNIMRFTVEAPHALSAEEITILKGFLARQTGKTILFSVKKNKNLIAGIKVYSGTRGFEHSVRKSLRSLGNYTIRI